MHTDVSPVGRGQNAMTSVSWRARDKEKPAAESVDFSAMNRWSGMRHVSCLEKIHDCPIPYGAARRGLRLDRRDGSPPSRDLGGSVGGVEQRSGVDPAR